MSNSKNQLQDALVQAMKSKNRERRDAIRLLQSAIKQVEIDQQTSLDDDAVIDILRREAKKRRETIAELERAGREADAAAERFALGLTEEFLPRQLTDDELRPIVRQAIDESGAASAKDIGKVMSRVMPQVRGLADGKTINALAREMLS